MEPPTSAGQEGFSISRIFFLADVAAILGIPKSQLNNWVNGRSLLIVPHRRAHGTGSRNVYDATDLYKFAIAGVLSTDGFEPRSIQIILDELGHDFASAVFALVTSGDLGHLPWKKSSKPRVQVVSQAQFAHGEWSLVDDTVSGSASCYTSNISRITERVDHLTEHLHGRVP